MVSQKKLEIGLYNLLWFTFFMVVSVSWFMSRVWRVNLVDLSFFYWHLFFQFYHSTFSTFGWLWLDCHFFGLFSIISSQSYDLGHEFYALTKVDLNRFIVFFFRFFFSKFHHLRMNLLEIKHNNYFDLLYLGLSWFHNQNHEFKRLTRFDPLCCLLNIFFKMSS